jgi:nickel superoxide dismutase
MKTRSHFLIATLFMLISAFNAVAHCQVPCGIFTDDIRFKAMLEDAETIRKACVQIEELSAADTPDHNQIVRWIMTKEDHAKKINQTVLVYFLAQRVKAGQDHYEDKLVALHEIIVAAMKTKQSTDTERVDALEKAIHKFEGLYHHHH